MTNGNDNAFAAITFDSESRIGTEREGLTKREYFAGLAMQAFIAKLSPEEIQQLNFRNISSLYTMADYSVDAADAIITKLNKNSES